MTDTIIKIFLVFWALVFCFLLIFSFSLNVWYAHKLGVEERQFIYTKQCLKDPDVTKDLFGAYINEKGRLECDYGIGNGIVERKELYHEPFSK